MIQSEDEVFLNFSNIVVLPKPKASGGIGGATGFSLDKHSFQSQQFMSSVTLKTHKPSVVGGSTIQLGESGKQLCLVLEAMMK